MGKRILSLALAAVLTLCLTGCSRNKAAARTPDVDFYIQFASEKFGVPEKEISVVEFEKASTAVTTRTVWITPLQKYTIPPPFAWSGAERRSPSPIRIMGTFMTPPVCTTIIITTSFMKACGNTIWTGSM